jgi:dolichol-phosphate mannosyltransferase
MTAVPNASPTDPLAPLNLSIIVPTYREAENLALLVPRIAAALAPAALRYEIIVVDDDSRDGSVEALAQLAQQGHAVRLITRVGERGLSSAVLRGFAEARGRWLLCMDADLSHPPEALPELLAAVREPGVEFVIGSRYVPGGSTDETWGVFRWLNSQVATLLARPFTAARDPMAGFFALPRSVFERAAGLSPIGYKIGLELIVKCRCQVLREVPIHFSDRKFGQSKLSFREQLRYLRHLVRLARFKYGRPPSQ